MAGIARAIRDKGRVRVVGIQGSAGVYIVSQLLKEGGDHVAVIVRDAERAEAVARDLGFFASACGDIVVFPSWEVLPFDHASPYVRLQSKRIEILRRLQLGITPRVLITPVAAWISRLAPRAWILRQHLHLARGEGIRLEFIVKVLESQGYQRVALVEEPGDYGIRGGILDCFPPNREEPIRMDFIGDSIESLRTFSVDTQRSTGRIEEIDLFPVREIPWSREARQAALRKLETRLPDPPGVDLTAMLDALSEGIRFPGMEFLLPVFHEPLETLDDYLPDGWMVVLDEPDALREGWSLLWETARERSQAGHFPLTRLVSPEALFLNPDEMHESLARRRCLELSGLHIQRPGDEPSEVLPVSIGSQEGLRAELMRGPWDEEALGNLATKFRHWLREGLAVHWVLRSRAQAGRLREHLASLGLPCHLGDLIGKEWQQKPGVWIHIGELSQGFLWPEVGLAFATEEEVFGPRRMHRPARPARKHPAITHLEDLQAGNLVVHVDHGIGIYRGLTTLEISGTRGDFLHLEYLGRDRLYVPVDRFQSVHKYLATEGVLPRLDRLGGRGRERRKRRVKKAVERMAKELLHLYAEREVTPGFAFSPRDENDREFEEAFPYEETPDQGRSIDEVMEDMSAPRPMDRLVCGDVGYGKTEVAMRAAFRAVMDGKQVAYLVPTTILAEQHHQTFLERFRGYPIFIEAMSRFRTPREQREILRKCREGTVDILIGTHRLLQRDVDFKDLGLLIIDEEQRFGVGHKEKLKKLRKEVDVMTLTATPIPRTLHMAMLGIRDLSVIETPPPERLSIRTVVATFDRDLVCEAVQRELARGGQVFFVHNRVQGIEGIARTLRSWLPGVRIGIAHGQLPEHELAQVMERFRRKEIAMLVCTTIIQSGLDIPTANTILIHDAQTLGLAEMYQIRGRVGRSGHQAYAYLLTPAGEGRLTEDAKRRLQTLQEFSELGAGFQIATRDLEIRGAGTLLGPSQSGNIEAVGFDLYTQLMRRAIAELKGEALPPEIEPEIHLPVHAYLPDGYVPDPHQRLALYRRLSKTTTEDEIRSLREEIEDRFGPLPCEGENLLHLIGLRRLLKALGVRRLGIQDGRLRIQFDPSTPVSSQGLVRLVEEHPEAGIRFVSGDTLEMALDEWAEGPLPWIAERGLKRLFADVSIGASNALGAAFRHGSSR